MEERKVRLAKEPNIKEENRTQKKEKERKKARLRISKNLRNLWKKMKNM
jgi:hypothetical protein